MEKIKVGASNRWCTACKSKTGPMFRFPKNAERREEWRQLLGLEQATDFTQICALHFRFEDVKSCKGLHRLVRGARPCNKASLTPKNTTRRSAKPTCFVPGCGNTDSGKITLHYFPGLYDRRCQWASVLKVNKVPSKHTLICSNHFKPSDFKNLETSAKKVLTSSATPSLNLGVSTNPSESDQDEEVQVTISEENVEVVLTEDAENTPDSISSDSLNSSDHQSNVTSCSYDDVNLTDSSLPPGLHEGGPVDADEGQSLEEALEGADEGDAAEISSVFTKLSSCLREDISSNITSKPSKKNQDSCSSSSESCSTQTDTTKCKLFDMIHDDTQLKAFTGVTFASFNILVKLGLELYAEDDDNIPMKIKIFLTLCKLRLNLRYKYLSALVGIDIQKCRRVFASTLQLLALVLQHTVYWPSKEEVYSNMPLSFRKYTNTRVVLDCIEVAVCCPDCVKCRIRLFSPDKGCQTVKVLLGIAPSGLITFVSKVYGGRASEKQIFAESELITKNLLEPHVDAVIVDKGFRIDAVCSERGIQLHRPTYVQKKQPTNSAQNKQNTEIVHPKVHVEHVILKMKSFKILQSKISWAVVPYLERIFVVVAGLVNLSPPVLSDDKFLVIRKL